MQKADFGYYMPVEVFFGNDAIEKIGEYARKLGERAFLVVDNEMKKIGVLNKVINLLTRVNMETVCYGKVVPSPVYSQVYEAAELAKMKRCDFVIGLGGGSCMDFAKGVAIAATHEEDFCQFIYGGSSEVLLPTKRTLPILAIPTTAGSGSQVTPYAVFVNPKFKLKTTIKSPYIFPRVVIVDPKLTISMPPNLTASTGVDALAHAMESYINVSKSNPFSDLVALEAIKIISENLRRAVLNGGDLLAREKMAWGSTLAGMAISQAGTTLVHAMSYPLTGRFTIPHGIAVAILLPEMVRDTWKFSQEKFANIAKAMGIYVDDLTVDEQAKRARGKIRELLKDIGIDLKLGSFNVTEPMLEQFANDTVEYMARPLAQHPGKFTFKEILSLYRRAL